MQKLAYLILKMIDFLYRPFRKLCPEDIFRYGICGASNMVLDWILYFLVYNFGIRHKDVSLYFLTLSPHIATLCIVFPITLLTGFWLNKYVTFRQSSLHGSRQLGRYILIVMLNLLINYVGLKLLVDVCALYPTPSKMLITLITVVVSFFGQKYFSFRK
ncbi:MAG: GtrA family protein [Paludibacter sp.]|nr:GtrA family protein [Bacteroidales bacterium]MCM1068519.1 GtrA family protein [Prevotella sp.]MCM1353473.1 GtrA family protein [Bacteroides sp.]MCM1442634.1 GtrA family protein [Muribaculum sp.]MCM1481479.1 GtrA family protein [Paludibacter sp.]